MQKNKYETDQQKIIDYTILTMRSRDWLSVKDQRGLQNI